MNRALVLAALAVPLAWILLHGVEMAATNPVLEARACAEAQGLVVEEADVLGGGYGSRLGYRFAYATLRERTGARRDVTVRVEKWVPFGPWSLVAVEVGDPELQAAGRPGAGEGDEPSSGD